MSDFVKFLRESDKSKLTIAAYISDLKVFAVWFEGRTGETLAPERVTPIDVRDFKSWLQDEYKPATVNRRLATLKVYCAWAVGRDLVESDPTRGIRWVRQVKVGPRWLTSLEQRHLYEAVNRVCQAPRSVAERWRAVRDRAMIAVMLWGGLRSGEVVGARLDKLTMNGRSARLVVRGKWDKTRTVSLNVDVHRALRAWLEVRGNSQSSCLFISQQGAGMTTRSVRRATKKYARRADIEDFTPHRLRHSCAKALVDRGVSLEKIALQLGHDSLDTTKLYLVPSQLDLDHAVEQIAWSEL